MSSPAVTEKEEEGLCPSPQRYVRFGKRSLVPQRAKEAGRTAPGRGADGPLPSRSVFRRTDYSASGPVMTPVTAEAAATQGLARYSSDSRLPMRPRKLRFEVEMQRSPSPRTPM